MARKSERGRVSVFVATDGAFLAEYLSESPVPWVKTMSTAAPMSTRFEHLLAAYFTRVHRAALGWMGNEHDARDVAQDALVKAYRARHSYDPARPFSPWLYTIVRNACRDALARRGHREHPALEADQVASPGPTPLAALSAAEAQTRIRDGMRRLSEEHREILVMRHFEDLSYSEMAEILNVPRGTVMSRLYRARKALAAELEDR